MMIVDHSSKPFLGFVALMISGLLLGGCNNTPNTNSSDGPTIQLSLAPVDPSFTWPPGTAANLINSANNNLQLLATTANSYQQYKWLPTESKPPNYDWRAGIAPADASGIPYFDVVVAFFSSCGGAIPGNNAISPWTRRISAGRQSNRNHRIEPNSYSHRGIVSPDHRFIHLPGPYQGLGQPTPTYPGGEVGMYYIAAKAINGKGKRLSD